MRHLHRISWLITLLGIGIILATWVADLDPVWLLAGILLAWAGLVKIVVVLIWTRVALIGTDEHRPTPSP